MSEFLSELPLHGKSSSRERGKGRKNRRSSKHSGVVDDPASRLRKHKHKHKAIDLMADMHNSIHQVRDDDSCFCGASVIGEYAHISKNPWS